MRADARRNHDAVLDAGARLLAERPSASMQEIADASGVGRTTVYRHFPAREDLVAALVARVADEVAAVTRAALAIDRPADAVFAALSHDIVALGRRWRFLRDQRGDVLASVSESDRLFEQWLVTAQSRGEVRSDLPAEWLVAAARGLTTEAITSADRLGPARASELLLETLISITAPRP